MAFQTAMVQKVAGRRIRTTYMTGMLSDFCEDIVDLVAWFVRRTKGRSWRRRYLALRLLPRQQSWVRSFLLAGIWLCFFLGAVCGAYAEGRVQAVALILPLIALIALFGIELAYPSEKSDRTPFGPS